MHGVSAHYMILHTTIPVCLERLLVPLYLALIGGGGEPGTSLPFTLYLSCRLPWTCNIFVMCRLNSGCWQTLAAATVFQLIITNLSMCPQSCIIVIPFCRPCQNISFDMVWKWSCYLTACGIADVHYSSQVASDSVWTMLFISFAVHSVQRIGRFVDLRSQHYVQMWVD